MESRLLNFLCKVIIQLLLIFTIISSSLLAGKINTIAPQIIDFSYYLSYRNLFPSYGAVHKTSKFSTTITSQGTIGWLVHDPFTDSLFSGFNQPPYSSIDYLNEGSIWVGGIINDDTLVSTGISIDIEVDSIKGTHYRYFNQEFYPPNAYTEMKSVNFYEADNSIIYHTNYVDTFTGGLPQLNNNPYQPPHKPLNLSIIQKSYSSNMESYRNILLLDYIITNIGNSSIKDGYVGIYIDGDISAIPNNTPIWNDDDLAGSFRDITTAYMIDNDGDPVNGKFGKYSPLDAIGIRPLLIYPPVPDTNFNWWCSQDTIDFGPRLKGIPQNPFRRFDYNLLGTPDGDKNKYYMLSHHEWDYDQLRTAQTPYIDSLWVKPETTLAYHISQGEDTRFLLSVGPVNLLPDSSLRVIYALFGGAFVHTNSKNVINLQNKDYDTYYSNLFFDIFQANANNAKAYMEQVINPLLPPTGLKVVSMNYDTANITWDRWVLPEVTGYKLYIKPIPDSMLFSPLFVKPNISYESIDETPLTYTTKINRIQITNLTPGKLYMALLTQQTSTGESQQSPLIIIGDKNPVLTVTPVKPKIDFAVYKNYNTPLRISWETSTDTNVQYYKIYKTTDSIAAYNRYYPFVSDDSINIPIPPKTCSYYQGKTICYYEMPAYDSVPASKTEYYDKSPQENASYWITAVSKYKRESRFSKIIQTEKVTSPQKDIVVILGSTSHREDYVYADSIIDFYQQLLKGYNFDIYNWTDSNLSNPFCSTGYCVNWRNLADYRLIIVEEYPEPKILSKETEPKYKLLTRLNNAGRILAYFGLPPGDKDVNLSSYTQLITYDSNSFENRYMGLISTSLKSWFGSYNAMGAKDTLAGFNMALPNKKDLPALEIKKNYSILKPFFKQLFNIENCLPYTPSFLPNSNAEILYKYHSYFPNSSELQNMPCGIMSHQDSSKIYTFSFHLWGMKPQGARQLIDYIMNNIKNDNPLQPLPGKITLSQNYPNPFNGETNIKYILPYSSYVTLTIYNILGQKVKNIINNQYQYTGTYYVKWDGTNNNGKTVSTGIYLYRLKTGNISITKKMVLLK